MEVSLLHQCQLFGIYGSAFFGIDLASCRQLLVCIDFPLSFNNISLPQVAKRVSTFLPRIAEM